MSSAAACVNPRSTGALTRFSIQAKPAAPRASWITPDRMASQTASATHCGLPGSARPISEAAVRTQVRAAGPTESRVELLKSTATSSGNSAAYRPVIKGMPVRPA